MRDRLERWVHRIWYEGQRVPWSLRLLSGVFRVASRTRHFAYHSGLMPRFRAPVPVLVVGNITAGGSGKTPIVDLVCRRAVAAGLVAGVASRGYGGRVTAARMVSADDDPAEVGDEPLMLKRRLEVPVAVAKRRRAAIKLLVAKGVDLVVMDDGLQHYAVERDWEIGVVDARRRFGNGLSLPAGPLRERPQRLDDCDLVLENGNADSYILQMMDPRALNQDATSSLQSMQRDSLLAVAGIGHPERFFAGLSDAGLSFATLTFPDHHSYTAEDVERLKDHRVITTEKDAVKLRAWDLEDAWYVPVEARVARAAAARIDAWLDSVKAR